MQSKSDLVEVTEAARAFLRRVHAIQDHFALLPDPHSAGGLRKGIYFDPLESVIFFVDAFRTARQVRLRFSESLKWELAALSSSRGIRVGVGVFPSAHEVLAEAARMVESSMGFLLISDSFFDKIDKSFSWEQGLRSLPQELQSEYADYWRAEGRASFFADLLWDLVSSLRPLRALQLRGVLDCEFALALRGRPSEPQPEMPKPAPASVSAITGRTLGPIGGDDYKILRALAGGENGIVQKYALVAQLAVRGVAVRTVERRLKSMAMEPLRLVTNPRRGVWQITPKGRVQLRRDA